MSATATEEPSPMETERATRADDHERETEEHEAYEYWGYLFKPDKTGTDKLKSLLRGLKDVMVCHRQCERVMEMEMEDD